MRTLTLTAPLALQLGLRHDHTLVEPSAPRVGQPVTISLWARRDAQLRGVELRLAPDGEEELHAMRPVEEGGTHRRYACTIVPRSPRLRYRFRLERPGGVLHLSMRGLSLFDPIDAFDYTLHLAPLPAWPTDAVLYQIFPDRFADGDPQNQVREGQWSREGMPARARRFGERPLPFDEGRNLDFYGGDLPGIEQRLGHLARLGVTGVFLNPIWPALSNHRYDYIDHGRVDPLLGGDTALASLSSALRARGMRLVLDVVINHTGSGHPWFNREGPASGGGAFHDPNAHSRRYYRFDEWPHRYRSWLGIETLPRLDLTEPALRDVLWGAPDALLRRFLRPPFSVDGYRFDVANMMGRDGEAQGHRELWSSLCGALRTEHPDVYLLGETFFDPEELQKGDGLDGVMAYHAFTFPLRTFLLRRDRRGAESALDGAGFMAHLAECRARGSEAHFARSTLHVNTHDIPRLQTAAAELGLPGGGTLDVATALQLALPGVPCLYYGDEIGLEGGADPDNRRCMEWDEARWDHARLERTSALIARRSSSEALLRGGLVDLGSEGDVIAFARVSGRDTKLVLASRSSEALTVDVPLAGLLGSPQPSVRRTLPPLSAEIVDLTSG